MKRTLGELLSVDSAKSSCDARENARFIRLKEFLSERQLNRENSEDVANAYTTRALTPAIMSHIPSAITCITDACRCMKRHGLVILGNERIVDEQLLESMSIESLKIEKVITDRLKSLKIAFSNSTLSDSHVVKSQRQRLVEEAERTFNFKYKEASSRCFGRVDIRLGMDQYPFNDPRLTSEAVWLPLVHSLLGEDMQLRYSGLIASFPGSSAQPW